MNLQFTAVFRRVPEGDVAFVEEFAGANTQGGTTKSTRAWPERSAKTFRCQVLACKVCKRLLAGESGRTIPTMTKAVKTILADAVRLDLDARAEVVTELLASLDGPADPGAEAAWAVEIERRVAAIDAGTIKLEPWDNVKRRIEKEILGR